MTNDSWFNIIQSSKFSSDFFEHLKYDVDWNAWNQLLETDLLICVRRWCTSNRVCHDNLQSSFFLRMLHGSEMKKLTIYKFYKTIK